MGGNGGLLASDKGEEADLLPPSAGGRTGGGGGGAHLRWSPPFSVGGGVLSLQINGYLTTRKLFPLFYRDSSGAGAD
jgi:hypothetical protein